MGKKDRKKKLALDADVQGVRHNPFAEALGHLIAESAEAPVAEELDAAPDFDADLQSLTKVILRMERKGRGGKTVTVVEGLEGLNPDAMEELSRRLRKMLGVGSSIEGTAVVFQGDQRDRLHEWFTQTGVRRVVRSG